MELQHTLSGIMTGILLVTFIAICIWSWSGKRKSAFDEMARLPLDDDGQTNDSAVEKREAGI